MVQTRAGKSCKVGCRTDIGSEQMGVRDLDRLEAAPAQWPQIQVGLGFRSRAVNKDQRRTFSPKAECLRMPGKADRVMAGDIDHKRSQQKSPNYLNI